ncbi:conserved hypothetical protein [Chlorobaculum parvum NCIB 8327]|uniref:MtN3 and saliva related transmembrane protein n=1 Tax=Chlorobaculum parvum (strain DSM 263 / NCIMB 8327) TaxID=517417 RepID=B3QLD5_CHLP8|nr:SemiSWEET transporter [Chlorobaculum parvum]ACF12373.1 conserved hypothetical protein [Chlorobaculum parvum NCIB 8327]
MDSEYLGYAAGILTTVAFLPQAMQLIRTRQARDISLTWAATMTAGVFFWLCYGVAKQSVPMISANGITLLLLLVILFIKLRYQDSTDTGEK